MSECAGVSGEQTQWLTLLAELEQELAQGFVGDIILHCSGDGTVRNYHLSEFRKPGEERRVHERRIAGPRDGDDRRKR